jgi:hypothetical protein
MKARVWFGAIAAIALIVAILLWRQTSAPVSPGTALHPVVGTPSNASTADEATTQQPGSSSQRIRIDETAGSPATVLLGVIMSLFDTHRFRPPFRISGTLLHVPLHQGAWHSS